MFKVCKGIPGNGFLSPQGNFVVGDLHDPAWNPDLIEVLRVKIADDAFLLALEMEISLVENEVLELLDFLSVTDIWGCCCEFRALCFDNLMDRELGRYVYLHRLYTFREILVYTMNLVRGVF